MDDDVKGAIGEIFSKRDAQLIEEMVALVEKDMTEANKSKRLSTLQSLLETNKQ